MSERSVAHATFVIERTYDAAPARVFNAWADPVAKARWFGPGELTKGGHELDFRVGGREINRGGPPGGAVYTFDACYQDIVPDERIVYTYETLDHFKKRWPRARLFFLLGSDSIKKLPQWRQTEHLQSMCRFIPFERLRPFASHDIRRRVRKGSSIRYLVPPAVERYIHQCRLYRKPE